LEKVYKQAALSWLSCDWNEFEFTFW